MGDLVFLPRHSNQTGVRGARTKVISGRTPEVSALMTWAVLGSPRHPMTLSEMSSCPNGEPAETGDISQVSAPLPYASTLLRTE